LNAVVPLDTWQAICKRAADDALAGDAKARDWLAKWLLGTLTSGDRHRKSVRASWISSMVWLLT
jgi:hypothetical protein